MDVQQCMIVDLERHGDKRMFLTEEVASINKNKNGLWAIRFSSSTRVFTYNYSPLLYLTHPEAIDLGEKGIYIKNKHVSNVTELLRFTNGHYTFYRVTYTTNTVEGSHWQIRKVTKNKGVFPSDTALEKNLMVNKTTPSKRYVFCINQDWPRQVYCLYGSDADDV